MKLIIRNAITFTAIKPSAILFDEDIVCPTYVDVMWYFLLTWINWV